MILGCSLAPTGANIFTDSTWPSYAKVNYNIHSIIGISSIVPNVNAGTKIQPISEIYVCWFERVSYMQMSVKAREPAKNTPALCLWKLVHKYFSLCWQAPILEGDTPRAELWKALLLNYSSPFFYWRLIRGDILPKNPVVHISFRSGINVTLEIANNKQN